jgi:hypothetical protein
VPVNLYQKTDGWSAVSSLKSIKAVESCEQKWDLARVDEMDTDGPESSTDLAVLVNVADLRKGKPESFYKLEAQAGSRKLPGAVVTRNPYVAAAKFVMSRRDLPKNIRQTAQTVADQIIRRAHAK